MKCPYCGAEVKEGDKFCGECGKAIKREEPKRKEPSNRNKLIIYTVVALIGLLLIVYILISISSSPPKSAPTVTPVPAIPSTMNASVVVLKIPPGVEAARPFEVSWRVNSPIEMSINHTAIHYDHESKSEPLGHESYRYISEIQRGSIPADFSTKITINNTEEYSAGVLYFRAHAIIDGIDYWSEEKRTKVQSTPTTPVTPTIIVTSYPEHVSRETNFTIQWTVSGGTPGMIHHTSVFWGFRSGGQNATDYSRVSTIQTGYTPAEFSVELKAPYGGTIYFRVHAMVDDTELYSSEYKITVD